MTMKLYLFNPFDIKNWKVEQVREQLSLLQDNYLYPEAETMYTLAYNAENLANQLYLIGEMIARLSQDVLLVENDVECSFNKQISIARKQWTETNTDKPPAMSYFEAMASEFVKEDRKKLAEKQSDLSRFKYAYEAIEAKMNALKKKMDAVKYEESLGG